MKPTARFAVFFTLHSTALVLLVGCARSGPAPAPRTLSPATEVISQPILQLFKAHGIDCRQKGDWLEFPNRSVRASGVIVEESNPESDTHSVQLDFRMELDFGRESNRIVCWGVALELEKLSKDRPRCSRGAIHKDQVASGLLRATGDES